MIHIADLGGHQTTGEHQRKIQFLIQQFGDVFGSLAETQKIGEQVPRALPVSASLGEIGNV